MGQIMAVNISEKKGTQKKNIHKAKLIEEYGVEGDAHAGKWHRQVSLLSYERIQAFKEKGAPVEDGAFGENLIVQGIDLRHLPVGTKLVCGNVVLEITQIGKECHSGCEIYKVMGDCIMPREGVFARVKKSGTIEEGDEIHVMETVPDVTVRIAREKVFFGPGVADLMELVAQTHSMKEACRQMGLSYTKGWRIINQAEHQTGNELIHRHHGGAKGGGTTLTKEGEEFLHKYRILESKVRAYAKKTYYSIFREESYKK